MAKFFLIVDQPDIAFTAIVTGTPVTPYMTVGYYGATGTAVAGETVCFGSTPGAHDLGMARLRTAPSAGSLTVGENYDVTPYIAAGNHITIKKEFRVWPIYPRITGSTAFLEDYNTVYTDETDDWIPTAVAGPPGVGFLSNGQAQVSFVGNQSYALGVGTTVSSYLWTADGSVEGTSADAGSSGSPVVFTWTAAGRYLVSLQVVDSAGKSHTAYTVAYIFDPDNPPSWVFTQFDEASENGAWDNGGWEGEYTFYTDLRETAFPPGLMVVHATDLSLTTHTATWPLRTNVLFVGRILGGTVYRNANANTMSLRAATVDSIMRNVYCYPGRMDEATTPTMWVQGKQLTVDRVVSYLAKYRSTLAMSTPLMRSAWTERIAGQDFGDSSLYAQLSDELIEHAWGKLVSSHQGVLYVERNANLMTTTERAALTTRKALTTSDWVGQFDLEETEPEGRRTSYVEASGILYSGTSSGVAMFSEAPGTAPKVFGTAERVEQRIISSQAELNTRCGHYFALANHPYPTVRMTFLNEGSFGITPQEYFTTTLAVGDTTRGIVWSAKKLIARQVERKYLHVAQSVEVDVVFEPEVSGNAGNTLIPETPAEPEPPKPPECPPGFHWDPVQGKCIPDDIEPVGTGKNVIIAATVKGVARIMRTTDITVASPTWEFIDNGGWSGEDWIAGGLKLDPWDDTQGAFAATSKKIYRCANFNAPTPVWTEILDIDGIGITAQLTEADFTGCYIKDYTLSIEEEGLILVAANEVPHGAFGYLEQPPHLCHTHDYGATWYHTGWDMKALSNDLWTATHGMSLDLAAEAGSLRPVLYVAQQGSETGGDAVLQSFIHQADHSMLMATGTVWITLSGARSHPLDPFIPYAVSREPDGYFVRALIGLANDSDDTTTIYRYDYASFVSPYDNQKIAAGPTTLDPSTADGVTGIYFNIATWNHDLWLYIAEDEGAVPHTYVHTNHGDPVASWVDKGALPVRMAEKAGSCFPYNADLVYALAEDVAGDAVANCVMYSTDLGDNWTDKTGDMATLCDLSLSGQHWYGRGIVPTWSGNA